MEFVITEALTSLDYEPYFIYIYADDIITTMPADRIDHTPDVFNSVDGYLTFTTEKEYNMSIPFLDILILRSDNRFHQMVYKTIFNE